MENYAGWDAALKARFPDYDSRERDGAWEELKSRLAVGQSVTGVVVARAHFGAWIDMGVEFPALLEIIHIKGLTPERYQAGDWYPVGSKVTAYIGVFDDCNHQIRLWQVRKNNSN